jgi:tRNA(adenine34) deaminase
MSFAQTWAALHPAFRRSLKLAYQSLRSGGLAVGAVLTDADGTVLAEGRNRAYDPPGGPDALQGTPLAHAEMNALAAARTDWELAELTLWSTQEPCSMCSAAAAFTGVGAVRHLAPDPSALAAGPEPPAALGAAAGPADDEWLVTANVLFLHSIASRAGLDHRTIVRNREVEPETAGIVVDLVSSGLTADRLRDGPPLGALLSRLWGRIVTAAASRRERTGG